jgi:hypothetical protein
VNSSLPLTRHGDFEVFLFRWLLPNRRLELTGQIATRNEDSAGMREVLWKVLRRRITTRSGLPHPLPPPARPGVEEEAQGRVGEVVRMRVDES